MGPKRPKAVDLVISQSALQGEVQAPGSKSHTIRAVAIAALAEGESRIGRPLASEDGMASVLAYRALGAEIDAQPDEWRVAGLAGQPRVPDNVIDVGNSGTTLRVAMGSCALLTEGAVVLTGDGQIRGRPCGPLAQSLTDLGASAWSTRGTGKAPFVVQGRLRGGETSIEAVTSQYLSSLLINAPLADGDSVIRVPLLNEAPYVDITLEWMERQGVSYEKCDAAGGEPLTFRVPGGQKYRPVERAIPGDWSSATFFLAAGALGSNDVILKGVDQNDSQGDRAVVDYFRAMGASIEPVAEGLRIKGSRLAGCEIDLNATPDALPMMAVAGCFASGTTRLVNVPQARLKETDRIAVMCEELSKLGAEVRELPDGLEIRESALRPAAVDGHGDHRVVMALAVAATMLAGETTITGYEAAAVTYPGFAEALKELGGEVRVSG